MRLQLLHLAKGSGVGNLWSAVFREHLQTIGDLHFVENAGQLDPAERLRACQQADVLITGWGCVPVPAGLAEAPGRLRYICHLTGTLREAIPLSLIRSGILVTNWGDAPAQGIAESTLTLLLASLKNLPGHILERRAGAWSNLKCIETMGTLHQLHLGIYGFGVIARRFVDMCRALKPVISIFDPYASDIPADIRRVDSLMQLFEQSQAVAVMAPLNAETTGSITAEHLAALPDHAVVINTARGRIFDETALFAELASGRLRAGLDVLTTDEQPLPADHPARFWPNVILTGHKAGKAPWPPDRRRLSRIHEIALDNLSRFASGQELRFIVDERRYHQST